MLLALLALVLAATKKVEVYTVDKCKYCQEVKTYLKEHFVEYQEIPLEGDKWGEMQRRAMKYEATVKKFGKPMKILVLAPQIFIDDVYHGTHRKTAHLSKLGAALDIESAVAAAKEGQEEDTLLSDDECGTCPKGEIQWEDSDEGEVVAMSESTFEADTSTGFFLIEFYAPWCPHCKKLAPVLADASVASEIKGKMKIVKIDATENKNLADKWGATSFPRLFWKRDGKMYRYLGGKTKSDFTHFAARMAKPAVVPEADVDSSERVHFRLTKGIGGDQAGIEKAFADVAAAMQDQMVFAQAADEGATSKVERVQSGTVRAYRGDTSGLEQWVRAGRFPDVVELSKKNFKEVSKFYRTVLVVGVFKDKEEDKDFLQSLAALAAEDNHEFAVGTLDGKAWMKYVNSFGLYEHHLPQIFVLQATKDRSYVQYELERSAAGMGRFVADVFGGKVMPKYSSYQSLWKEEGAMGFVRHYGLIIGGGLAVFSLVVTQLISVAYAEYEGDQETDEGKKDK